MKQPLLYLIPILLFACGKSNNQDEKRLTNTIGAEVKMAISGSDTLNIKKEEIEPDSLKSIQMFRVFSESYSPTRKPNSGVATLPETPDTVLQALEVMKKSEPKEFEKYLTLIFIKLYSAHLECCHQSYEIRKLPLGNLDKNREPLIYEFNILANKYIEGNPIEFISSSIGYDYVKSNPHLLGFEPIKKHIEIIEQVHKKIEQGM